MNASISLVEGTGLFLDMDMAKEVIHNLHESTPELRDMEGGNIQARTPVDTGALSNSEKGIAYTAVGTEDLVYLYADDEEQIAEWGRVYAPYQEGAELGLSTYTNEPHEMFARVLTNDLADIEEWGMKALNGSMDSIASGGGAAA